MLFAGVLGFGEFVGWCCMCGFLWVLISCGVGAALLLVWWGWAVSLCCVRVDVGGL